MYPYDEIDPAGFVSVPVTILEPTLATAATGLDIAVTTDDIKSVIKIPLYRI
jgi:hypothetical protein